MSQISEYAVKLTADIGNFVNNMKTAASSLDLTQAQVARFSRQMERSLDSSNPAAQKMGASMKALSERYAKSKASLEKFTAQVAECGNRLQALSSQYDAQQAGIAATEQEVGRLEEAYKQALATQEAMQQQMASGTPVRTQVFERVRTEVLAAKEALDSARASLTAQQAALAGTESEMQTYGELASELAAKTEEHAAATSKAKDQMLEMSTSSSSLTKVAGFLKNAANKAKDLSSALKKTAKTGFTRVLSGVSGMVTRFREAHTQSSMLASAAKTLTDRFGSFGSMLVRRFKRQLISEIFNGLKNGINNVARESAGFNSALSGMSSAAQQFANQLGAAFAPLVQAVAPVISRLIGYFTAGLNAFSAFTAKLTGQTTYKQALPVAYDYAASLDSQSKNSEKAAKSTEKQNKAAEKLKRTLLSFDQIHKLEASDNDTSNSAGSSGDVGTDTGAATTPKFQTASVDGNIPPVLDRIAKAFQARDWSKLGKSLAQGVNQAFSWADRIVAWENCGKRITGICKAITETFNSFVGELDWGLIGKTVGDGVQTLINTILLLGNGVDWEALGAGIGEGIKSLTDTIDFVTVGEALMLKFNIIFELLHGYVSTPGLFDSIGTAFSDTFRGMIDAIDPTMYGETIAGFFNGFFRVLELAFSDVSKFAELGKKIGSNVNAAFNGIDPAQFGRGVTNFVVSVFTAITSFFEAVDWQSLGKKVASCLGAIDWGTVATTVFKALGSVLGGLAGFFVGLFSNAVAAAKKYFNEKIAEFEAMGGDIGYGLLYGIGCMFVDIGKWIFNNIFKPIYDGIVSAFDIHSPSHETESLGKDIGQGLLDGIVSIGESIIQWFTDLPGNIISAVGDIGAEMMQVGKDLVQGISDGINSLNISLPHFSVSWDLFDGDGFNFSLPEISVDWYAKGGFPEDGLFMANHGEMVGQFSNGRTAVANNEQIVAGISRGVQDAIAPFILELLTHIDQDRGDTSVQVDGIELARIVTKKQKWLANYEGV